MWYSICDIKLPFAEEVLRRDFFVQGEQADPQSGWIPPVIIFRFYYRIAKIIKDLFDSRKTSEQSYIVNLFILPQEFCLNF